MINNFKVLGIPVIMLLLSLSGCYLDDGLNGEIGSGWEDGPTSISDSTGARQPVTMPQPQKKWTVLVYMAGDNNLSPYSTLDVEEMKKVGSNDNVNIVLLWDNDPSQDSGAQGRHGYYFIRKGEAVLLNDTNEVNTGSVTTAKNFIDFAVKNFKADHYMWVFWNHGGAVDRLTRGVGWDDTNDGDHLTEAEQKDIMAYFKAKAGKKIDIVGFDACLMATAEIAYLYKDYADYLVASEQTIPGEGWDYNFLSKVTSNPGVTASSLAKYVLTYYKNYYAKRADGADATFSVINLAYAKGLAWAMNDFAVSAMNDASGKSAYKKLAQGLPMFGYYSAGSDNYYYTRDLHAYLDKVHGSSLVPQAVKDKSKILMDIITDKKLVVAEWHGSDWVNEAYGISIMMKYATAVYKKLDICKDTKWDEFLNWAGFPNNDLAY